MHSVDIPHADREKLISEIARKYGSKREHDDDQMYPILSSGKGDVERLVTCVIYSNDKYTWVIAPLSLYGDAALSSLTVIDNSFRAKQEKLHRR